MLLALIKLQWPFVWIFSTVDQCPGFVAGHQGGDELHAMMEFEGLALMPIFGWKKKKASLTIFS